MERSTLRNMRRWSEQIRRDKHIRIRRGLVCHQDSGRGLVETRGPAPIRQRRRFGSRLPNRSEVTWDNSAGFPECAERTRPGLAESPLGPFFELPMIENEVEHRNYPSVLIRSGDFRERSIRGLP